MGRNTNFFPTNPVPQPRPPKWPQATTKKENVSTYMAAGYGGQYHGQRRTRPYRYSIGGLHNENEGFCSIVVNKGIMSRLAKTRFSRRCGSLFPHQLQQEQSTVTGNKRVLQQCNFCNTVNKHRICLLVAIERSNIMLWFEESLMNVSPV